MSNPTKSETMYRMEAMRHAGLQPDMQVTVDTLALDRNSQPMLIPNARWMALYNDNLTVRLAYDQAKYGTANHGQGQVEARATITPASSTPPQPFVPTFKREPFIDVTPVPEATKPRIDAEQKPMGRTLLLATARGHAKHLAEEGDGYLAWILNELADQLERKDADQHKTE